MNNTASPQPKNFFHRRISPILLGLLVIILALLAAAHLVLERHCAVMARQRILPWLQARYQADVQLQNISINILTGVLVVEGATIGHPPGFAGAAMAEMPHFRLRLALRDLWRKDTITVRSLRIKDARLNLIRNPQGRLNLAGAAESDGGGAPGSAGPDGRPAAPGPQTESPRPPMLKNRPRLAIDKARIHTRLLYTDHSPIFQPAPLELELELQIALDRLANYGRSDRLTGKLQVDGAICVAGQRTPLELRGRMAPLTGPRQLTFELTGSTKPFDLTDAPPLAAWLGVEQGLAACTITLAVSNNALDPEKSMLHFNFSEARLAPAARRRLGGIALPRVFTLRIPLSGTLESPRADFEAAIAGLLTSDDMIGSFLQGLYQAAGQADADAAAQAPAATP